jgi:alkyl hydroperoxide reductase subunit AhpC
LNEPAPDFDANTTHGAKKLADYKGKWLILLSLLQNFPVTNPDSNTRLL